MAERTLGPAGASSGGDRDDLRDATGLNKAQKFVRILELLQASGGILASELQQRFDLDDRTLRRYMADLKELDIPLKSEGRGEDRRFWVDPSYGRKGVQLTLLELVSLHCGRSLFDFMRGTMFASDMDEAMATLSSLASGSGLETARDLERKFVAVPEHRKDHSRHDDLLDEILSALLYQNPARAHYARVGGPMRPYVLRPYSIAIYRQSLYLFAWDVEEERLKTFALDRFRHFERIKGERFDVPPDYNPHDVVKDCFGITGGLAQEVVLRFNRRSTPYIRERIWHESQKITALEDGGVRLAMRVGLSPELTSWVLGFGPDVRVEAPEELRDHVQRLHREAAEGIEASGRR
jgi:predicted DNA-binding transcriptional regulator YafY